MDIQKELIECNNWILEQDDDFVSGYGQGNYALGLARLAWQAAKAQAVPEGFVLVDEDTIEDIKDSFSLLQEDIAVHRDYGTEHTARRDFNEILERATKLKAMIEAQEPGND